MEIVNNFIEFSTSFISSGGFIFGFLLILLESLLPVLPLGVFIALNINAFGMINGMLLSWTATCLGCFLLFINYFLKVKRKN